MAVAELPIAMISATILVWAIATLPRASGGGISMRLGLAATAIGLAFHLPGLQAKVIDQVGPRIMTTIYHSLFMIAGMCILDILAVIEDRTTKERIARGAVGVAALLLAALPWMVGAHPNAESLLIGPDYYSEGWPSAAHMSVVSAYMTWAALTLVRHCSSHALDARVKGHDRLATGIAMIAAAAIIGLVCLGVAAAAALTVAVGQGHHVDPATYTALTTGTMACEVALAGLGATWVTIWARLEEMEWLRPLLARGRARRARRLSRRALPMIRRHWEQVTQAMPELSLFAEDLRRPAASQEELIFHELRMTQEITDAHRRIYAHVSPADLADVSRRVRSAGLTGASAEVVTELCLIQRGLHRLQDHRELPRQERLNPPPPRPTPVLARQLRWGERLLPRVTKLHPKICSS